MVGGRVPFLIFMWDKEKELSLCHILWFSNHYIFGTKCCRPYIYQTMNSVRSNNMNLKYQRLTTSSSKDIEV